MKLPVVADEFFSACQRRDDVRGDVLHVRAQDSLAFGGGNTQIDRLRNGVQGYLIRHLSVRNGFTS